MAIKYSFQNDYSEGAHPDILEALAATNLTQDLGYGEDTYCVEATERIRADLAAPQADVHFVSGGTQANLIALSAFLKPYESVIAAQSAHIHVHEAGALEATGHKINLVPGHEGKLSAEQVGQVVALHTDEHMVKPRVVFISQSTELGTIYTAGELETLSRVCRQLGLYLYLDGARLGSALTSTQADFRIQDLPRWLDAFYIGGTKNGALLGEALVLLNPSLKPDFRFHLKQRGALLSKGRLLGIQFLALFKDGLYYRLAEHANRMAGLLVDGIRRLGYTFLYESPTNQVFPIFPNPLIQRLNQQYLFYTWENVDTESSAVRLVTSWATRQEAVEAFLADLEGLSTGP